jgi:hypothetical protein
MDSNERDTGPDSPDSPEWVDPWSWRAYPEPPAEPEAPEEDEPPEGESAGDEPVEEEPTEGEPAKDEPVGDEPAEDEPAAATPSDEDDDSTVEMAPVTVSDAEPSEAGERPALDEPEGGEAIQLPDLDPAGGEKPADPGAEPPDDPEVADAGEPEEPVDSASESSEASGPAESDDLEELWESSDPDEAAGEPEAAEDDPLAAGPLVEPPAEAALGEEEHGEPTDWAERVRLLEDVEAAPPVPLAIEDLWDPQDLAELGEPEAEADPADVFDGDDEGDADEEAAAATVVAPAPGVGETTQPLPPVPVARPSRPAGPSPPPVVVVPPPLTAQPPDQPSESPVSTPPARRPAIRVIRSTPPEPAPPEPATRPEPLPREPSGPPEPPARSAPPAPTPWLLPVEPVTPGWLAEPAATPTAPQSPLTRPFAPPGLPPPAGGHPEVPFPPLRLPEPPRDRGPRPLPPSRGGTAAPTPPPPWADQGAGWNRPGAPNVPWGLPPVPAPSRRTATRRTWVIVVAVLAALAVGSFQLVSLVRSGGGEPATASRAPAGRPGQSGTSASPLTPEQQVTRLLSARSNALLHHDKAAFLATVDSQRKSFYHAQAVLYDRMATVPFSSFTYSFPSPLRDLGTEGSRQRYSPAVVFTFPVEASYRFKGQDTNPLLARFYYTFEVTRAGWRIAGQDDVKAPLRSDVEIWDAAAVRTLSTARTLVVFHPGDATLARRLLTVAEHGYAQVAASWSSSWDQRVVILLPADQKEAQRLVRTRDLSDVAAVTSSAIEAGPAHRLLGNRIIVNTSLIAGYRTLDLQVVMTHEMTHVATRKVGIGVPLYLVEGFADYTALRPLAAPLRLTRPSLASAVRGNRFKGKLPSRTQLVGAGAALAYDEGSSFCLWVATSLGEGKLQALYRSFGDLDTDPTRQDEDVRFRRVLGISRATAESRWAAFVKEAV